MSTTEFNALVAVARYALGAGSTKISCDPDALLRLAEQHRMRPHLHRFAQAFPDSVNPAVRAKLQDFARHNAQHNLQLLAATAQAVQALSAARIKAVVLKGPLLARELYGDSGLRECADIDVLIAPAQAAAACAVLSEAGWQAEVDVARHGVDWILARRHDITFEDANGNVLELHCDAAQPHYAFNVAAAAWLERARPVPLGTAELLMLAPEDAALFALLHGTKHLWSRLDLLLDYAALRRRLPAADLLHRPLQAAGLVRAAAVADSLCREVLQLPEFSPTTDATALRLSQRLAARLRSTAVPSYWQDRRTDLFMRERLRDRLRYAQFMVLRFWRKMLHDR